jgi:hypothetical protein
MPKGIIRYSRGMRVSPWLLCVAVACGNDVGAPTGDAVTADAPGAGLGALMPQEVLGSASAVMTSPTVVAISYSSDPEGSDVEPFYTQFAASPAWAIETAEYGIGPVSVGTPQQLPDPVASSDTDVRTILTTNLTGSDPAWGPANEDTVYVFTLPAGSPFVDNFGDTGFCGAYHDDFFIGSADVSYAIECPCTSGNPPGLTQLQVLTWGLSHELVEGVTDPRFEHELGWGGVDSAHAVWSYVTDGEVADLCEFTDTAFWTDPPDMTFTIQRVWSNAAAHAGTDPCVGSAQPTYYQSVPEQPDAVTITLFGSDVATTGEKVALGFTGKLTLHVAGTAGSGPFEVIAGDIATLFFGAQTPLLSFTQPTGTFQVGDTVSIPVTVMAKDSNLGGAGAEAFEIETKPVNGGPSTYFYGLVGQ